MKIKIDNLSSLPESNNFLRALWAELRSTFGKCAWNYQPFKDGSSNTIFLGWANLNQNQTIPISLTYSHKSIVNGIHFGEQFDKTIDENSNFCQQLRGVVESAYQRRNNPNIYTLQVPFFSLYRALAHYSGDWFEILPYQHPISLLSLKIKAFDDIDAKSEFLRVSSYFLDILSVETNSLFWLSEREDMQNIKPNVVSERVSCPDENTFVPNGEWMDDIPNHNGYLLISSKAVQFLDCILSKDELSLEEETFIRSCHHFHVARGQDALVYDQLISSEKNSEDGVTTLLLQEHPQLKSASMVSKRAEEIATVLYMSAIEVASTINSSPSERCATCGQKQYKISARVINFVKNHLALHERHHLIKVFKSHYGRRSKYLHAGIVMNKHPYTGTTIPTLDPSSDSGVSQRTSVHLINLREWIGYMLRKQLTEIHVI
jgi:hypothetical protein